MIGKETLNEINAMRKKALRDQGIMIAVMVLGVFGVAFSPVLGIVFIILVFLFGRSLPSKKNYMKLYKEKIVRGVYEQMFDHVSYTPDKGFSREWVEEKLLISRGNRFYSDDYVSGEYKGCHFERSDVTMQDHRSTGKSSYTVTLFRGPWMVFDLEKSFQSYTKIVEREFLNSGKPSMFSIDVNEIEMENIEFNQQFRVYTTNEHDAFYVLTPHFMEKLMEIEKRYGGKMTVGLINSQLHLLLYTDENAFEAPLMEEVTEQNAIVCQRQADIVCELIDSLDLDRMEETK